MSAPAWRKYLRFFGNNLEADLEDEFRFHFETEIDDLVARGLSPEAARREALRRFGDVDQFRQTCRAADITSKNVHAVLDEKLNGRNRIAHAGGQTFLQPQAEGYILDLVNNAVLAL